MYINLIKKNSAEINAFNKYFAIYLHFIGQNRKLKKFTYP